MAGFLLDTNVVSELVRPRPAEQVAAWFEAQPGGEVRVSVITLGEPIRGVVRMPDGRRREALNRWVREDLPLQFQGRILPFDGAAAVVWGEMVGEGSRRGRPLPISSMRRSPPSRSVMDLSSRRATLPTFAP